MLEYPRHVGAADAASGHVNQRFAGPWLWLGHPLQTEIAHGVQNQGLHRPLCHVATHHNAP
jgi:hypothetical protein